MKHVKTVKNVLFVKFSKNEMPCQSEFMDGCKFCPERGLEEQERSVHSVCAYMARFVTTFKNFIREK